MTTKVMPVMVSFFTYGWTQQCIRCFQDWFPELKVLVVDNNPTHKEQMKHWNWCGNPRSKWNNFYPYCLAEREWLEQQDNVILIKPDKLNDRQTRHGEAIDLAVDWCKNQNFDIMLCIEPDVIIKDVIWFYDLLEPILDNDMWFTGVEMFSKNKNEIHTKHTVKPCPIMVRTDKIEWSFNDVIVDRKYYDFSHYVYHKFSERGRAKRFKKDFKGFIHSWSGSYTNFISNQRHCPYVTFL